MGRDGIYPVCPPFAVCFPVLAPASFYPLRLLIMGLKGVVLLETKDANGVNSPLDALGGSAFSRVADAKFSEGNKVRVLCDGAENYPVWLAAIARSTRTIHLENYILADDEIGRAFATALAAAAARGVRCRILYDWMGCFALSSQRYWHFLRHRGVDVRSYNPPKWFNGLAWISRNHRKLLCVDGYVAFTGGLCIGDNWVWKIKRNQPPWRDTAVELFGPIVGDLENAFADSWATTGPPIPNEDLTSNKTAQQIGGVPMWMIAGRPNSMGLYKLERLIAEIVEHSLWLSDAYFVATTEYVRALSGAARAGVDVRLLVPGSSDLPIIGILSQAGYRPLLEAGVRVFEWNGPMMHAKTAVADGRWTRIGSSNSNFASWISNRELDVTIKDGPLAKEMEALFERDLRNATEIVLESKTIRKTIPIGQNPKHLHQAHAGRLIAGIVGLGNIVGATMTQRRTPGQAETIVLSAGAAMFSIFGLFVLLWPHVFSIIFGSLSAFIGLSILIRNRKTDG